MNSSYRYNISIWLNADDLYRDLNIKCILCYGHLLKFPNTTHLKMYVFLVKDQAAKLMP